MPHRSARHPTRGMTVLTLLLLIIAVVIVALFVLPYLRATSSAV
jgi:hypothetical protein